MRNLFGWLSLALTLPAFGAERAFNFSEFPPDKTPPGFRSALAGGGKPGDWRIVMDEVPLLLAPLTPQAPVVTRRAVLAQLSPDTTDERFPLLIFDGEIYGDFTLTTRFKLVGGEVEQMAGIAFRIQDEKNFYVIRASGLGNNLRFYKVVNGGRGILIGPELEIPKGVWHELKIQCQGNQIHCWLNGQEAIPTLTDNTFTSGKIGFWTKSDAVSYFADTQLSYKPRELPAQTIVRDMFTRHPRLLGLQVYTLNDQGEPRLVAGKDEKDVGAAGTPAEKDVIINGNIYYGKARDSVSVVMPWHDRNGDVIAAIRVKMSTFAGQTEQTAVVRATPVVKEMEAQARSLRELTQ